jgi:predicted metalloprotease with PDZ domain
LADAPSHLAHVSIRLPNANGSTVLNMPVWNALYQVRNFAAEMENVQAHDANGVPVPIVNRKTSEWQVSSGGCVVVSYDVHLDNPGPFGSQLNAEHGFFNWAMVLMYSPGLRAKPASIRLLDVPAGWALRDTHVMGGAAAGKVQQAVGVADNYDTLVDSPAEVGSFREYSFEQDGAAYHIVVHASPDDYDSGRLLDGLKRVTHAAVDWMQDRPYQEYTFLYHFPRGPAAGGMEHSYGTVIEASAASGKVDLGAVFDVSAHEFFHLWNVKRIRPQSLEPIDYQHEQGTRALWFSEGVTSAVGDILLARAGLIDAQQYLSATAREITELEGRPAHAWQSAEESSLDAWFEGNAFYRTPERSINYYNKGHILGVLLDLRIRQMTHGTKSLRDLFQWINQQYAKQHRYFPDSAGVQEAAETVTGQSFAQFFSDYVAGVKPIPYNDAFAFVGLELRSTSVSVADPGFVTTSNIGGQPEVTSVVPGSEAARAGLQPGDRITDVDGRPADPHLNRKLARMQPGDVIKLRVAHGSKEQSLKIKLGSRQEQQYVLQDAAVLTPEQRAHRSAWIRGDNETGGVP